MRRGRAQAIVWVAVMLPVLFLPIVGVSIDAGLLFDARREAQNVADSAARVGAMELDREYLLQHGKARIDKRDAEQQARAYARRSGFAVRSVGFEGEREVIVTVGAEVQPTFMRMFKYGPVDVRAAGRARACQGTSADDACS